MHNVEISELWKNIYICCQLAIFSYTANAIECCEWRAKAKCLYQKWIHYTQSNCDVKEKVNFLTKNMQNSAIIDIFKISVAQTASSPKAAQGLLCIGLSYLK